MANTSTMGALERGIFNALSLGMGDEALTGLHKLGLTSEDYGQDIRDDEALDEQEHPTARLIGQGAGAAASLLVPGLGEMSIPRAALMGAVNSIGDSNAIPSGDYKRAVEDGAMGALAGGLMSKVGGMIKPKVPTDTSIPQIYQPGLVNSAVRSVVSKNKDLAQLADDEAVHNINGTFPNVIENMNTGEDSSVYPYLQQLRREVGGNGYNASDLLGVLKQGIREESTRGDRAAVSDILDSPEYKMAESLAPIHRSILESANYNPSNPLSSMTALGAGAIGSLLDGTTGGIVGGLGTKAANIAASSIAGNVARKSLQDNSYVPFQGIRNGISGAIGKGAPVAGNMINGQHKSTVQETLAEQGFTPAQIFMITNPSPIVDDLAKKGFTPEQIQYILSK